jgi:membrane-bound lytic murein transglycosylase A
MKGIDNYGNVKISSYYTPVVEARKNKNTNFKYPIYSMPFHIKKNTLLPKRKDIYNGVLDKKYILAYSNSLINNFIMEIQGSAFIDYGNNKPLTFFSYSGKNGWPYKGIGQILINRGEIKKKNMSMQAIKNWCTKHTEKEIRKLFEENQSFVFFKETKKKQVYGASAVPLIAKTSVAADNSIIKNGSVILLQVPLLDKDGIFINKYEMRLVIALDVGGVIKGQHFDIYEGIGDKAGILAGYYNHYGYAWVLNNK